MSEECRTPPSLQPCGAPITAYYYNSETGNCEVGAIGGCGYQNTYRSEEECERRCGAFKDIGKAFGWNKIDFSVVLTFLTSIALKFNKRR